MIHQCYLSWNPVKKILAILMAFGIITVSIVVLPHGKLEQEYSWTKDTSTRNSRMADNLCLNLHGLRSLMPSRMSMTLKYQ